MANPNPSPSTRFKKGQSGNPSGRSSEELKNLSEAAKIASELTLKALSSLQEKVNSGETLTEDDLALLLCADTRGMIKEAQDRAHGTPSQDINHRSDDGSMTPHPTTVEFVSPQVGDEGDN